MTKHMYIANAIVFEGLRMLPSRGVGRQRHQPREPSRRVHFLAVALDPLIPLCMARRMLATARLFASTGDS